MTFKQLQAYTGGRIMKQAGKAPRRNVRNECAKTRPASDPYEIWQSPDRQWTWKVLKKWQVDDNKPFARWFCHVTSPFCPGGELGDTYVKDVKAYARRVAIDPALVQGV